MAYDAKHLPKFINPFKSFHFPTIRRILREHSKVAKPDDEMSQLFSVSWELFAMSAMLTFFVAPLNLYLYIFMLLLFTLLIIVKHNLNPRRKRQRMNKILQEVSALDLDQLARTLKHFCALNMNPTKEWKSTALRSASNSAEAKKLIDLLALDLEDFQRIAVKMTKFLLGESDKNKLKALHFIFDDSKSSLSGWINHYWDHEYRIRAQLRKEKNDLEINEKFISL